MAYGARRWSGAPERRLRALVALLAVCYLPLVLMPGVVAMTALAALAGVFLAPCIACAFIIVDRHAPKGTVTEAFSWLVTTFTVGASVGTGLAGPVVEWGGGAGFALPGVAGAAALVVLLATGRVLSYRDGAVVAVSSENDPNRAVEPRFSSGIGRNVQSWTAAFSGWRTSTASRVRSGDSAACLPTRWRGTSSAVSCHGAAAAMSFCGTVPASTPRGITSGIRGTPNVTT